MKQDRRDFFKVGVLGVAGFAMNGLSAVEKDVAVSYPHQNQKALLLSSSGYKNTGFLNHALNWIEEFAKENNLIGKQIALVPYASVRKSYDELEELVQKLLEPLRLKIIGVHHGRNAREVIEQSSAVMVSGGNTFKLMHDLYKNDLVDLIAKRASKGTPYIGWSAGSNIAGATMMTTNDMPIIQPRSFNALNIFPYQINPHFISGKPKEHNGESREERLQEFLIVNPKSIVYALPEGVALKINGKQVRVLGKDKRRALLKMSYQKSIEKIEIDSTFEIS